MKREDRVWAVSGLAPPIYGVTAMKETQVVAKASELLTKERLARGLSYVKLGRET